MRSCILLIAWLVTASAWAQITITPDKPEPYDVIVASVNLGDQIPEGAKVRGSWSVESCQWTPCGENIHIAAKPGKHTIRASGVWVLTRDVTVGEETFPVLVDFGQYDYTKEVLVGDDPVPPPPPPGDEYRIVMFYQADRLDNYPESQRQLLTSLKLRNQLEELGHIFLEALEVRAIDSASETYAPFINAVKGDSLPRLAIVPVDGGEVRDYPLPNDYDALLDLLENPQ